MSLRREIFWDSGPFYLTSIDWDNIDHQKTILSSLVQGVYGQEQDRLQDGQGSQGQTCLWWEFFDFQLNNTLIDGESIVGAIYELKSIAFSSHNAAQNAPKYVIAFRGIIIRLLQDHKLNFKLLCHTLDEDRRFENAVKVVMELADRVRNPSSDIWLAGHSLGSAMALRVGKHCMTQKDWPIETYLFNPPYLPTPIESMSNNETLNDVVHFTHSFAKAVLACAIKGERAHEQDEFVKFSNWVPKMFVNPDDHICSGYIGYFEYRRKMDKIHAGKIEMLATQNSLRSLISEAFGTKNEALHLLPSANLTINQTRQDSDFRQAHRLRQWWDRNFVSTSQVHRFGFSNA